MRFVYCKPRQWVGFYKRFGTQSNEYAIRSSLSDLKKPEYDLEHFSEFKKTIKSLGIEHKDGSTCLRLDCRLCQNPNEKRWAYVNKKTGNFICHNCDINVSLAAAKSCYTTKKHLVNYEEQQKKFSFSKQNVVTEVPLDICESLNIKGLKAVDLEIIGAQYDIKESIIYFPLKNASNIKVGEKLLKLAEEQRFSEETIQNENNSGLLLSGQPSKTKAIVVSNILDFLALIGQRIDTRKFK